MKGAVKKILDACRLRERPDIAEILFDRAHWLILQVTPGDESMAAAHLAGRGYGIFVPGTYVEGRWTTFLPGYVFVHVYGIEEHRTRILACPGVSDFIYEIGHPSCPFVVPDQFIATLRHSERDSIGQCHAAVQAIARGNPRKRHRKRQRSLRIRTCKKKAA